VTRFTYDAVGNRLSLTAPGTSINYSYDADDRLLFAGTSSFTYDANGNQTSKTQMATGQPIVYSYDAANRLVATSGGAINSSFAYDGDGNRISQSVGTGTYNYLNDIATALPVILQESGPDGNISYAYGLSLISESSSAFDFFYHYDGLGSVAGLTDPAGKLAGRYVYDAWGQTDLSVPDTQIGTKNKFRFTGEALDPGTQLYYLRARYYDASTGRLLAEDPIQLKGSAYAYARQNPISWIDPSGLSGWLTIYSIGYHNGTGGHSWISYKQDGEFQTTTYGSHPQSGVQVNWEVNYTADVSRGTYLSDAEEARLYAVIQANQAWGDNWLTNDCAAFAAKAWYSATGEWLDPYWGWDPFGIVGFGLPELLKQSILAANGGQTSGVLRQAPINPTPGTGSIARARGAGQPSDGGLSSK